MERKHNWKLWTWWNARIDGRHNLPSPEASALGETERQIQTATNLAIRDAEERHALKARPLEAELARLRKDLDEIYEPEYQRLQQITGRHDVQIYLSRPVHFFLLLLLTAGEMAFNLVAFNIYREPALYTALMALAVVVSVPLCAWFIGLWVRQWPPPWWKTAIKLIVVLGILTWVLFGVNRIRVAYLRMLAPEFLAAHPELEWAFLAVNGIVVLGAALVTYLAHDPQPGFAEAKRKVDRHHAWIQGLQGRLRQLESRLHADAEIAKESGWQLIAYYRMINRRQRQSVPRYFDDDSNRNYRPEFATLGAENKAEQKQREVRAVGFLAKREVPSQ